MSQAIEDVLAERKRQIEEEGWTEEHDDEHDDQSLAMVAALYALPRQLYDYDGFDAWPASWEVEWDKRSKHDRRRRLVIAAALMIAEIERIDRAGKK